MLHWLEFRDRQASERPLVKSSKIAAGVGARDIFGFESCIGFMRTNRYVAFHCRNLIRFGQPWVRPNLPYGARLRSNA